MRKTISLLCMLVSVAMLSAATIPTTTGIVAEDVFGNTFDIDALLNSGVHIVVHQMFSG